LLPQIEGQIIGLSGQATPEETGQLPLSWFVGLAPATASPITKKTSAALTDQGLTLDPTQIESSTAPPTVAPHTERARYAVVAVVVTDSPQDNPALRIGEAAVGALLDSSTTR
jgi:hypothetical protein